MRHAVRRRAVVEKASLLGCFLDPCIVVAVAVEDDALVIADRLADHLMQHRLEVLCLLQAVCVDAKALSHSSVQHDVRAGDAVGGTEHTELELVSGKCERRRTVAVRRIAVELRKDVHA